MADDNDQDMGICDFRPETPSHPDNAKKSLLRELLEKLFGSLRSPGEL